MPNPTCIICGTSSPFLLNKDGYDLFKCPQCGLVFVHPQPKSDFLAKEVYSFESGYQGNKKRDLSLIPADKKTIKIREYLSRKIEQGKLLDVGCSNGQFMYHMEQKGFDAYGVELNPRTAQMAIDNGLKVKNGLLEDAHYPDGFFDAIFLGDIIEHVISPDALINECFRILKEGGLIVISTPNLDCLWSKITFPLYRLFKIPWSSVTPPYHLFQFSYGNLNQLMQKHRFERDYEFFIRPPRLMYELGSQHLLKRYKKSKKLSDFLFLIFSSGIYAIFYVVDFLTTPFRQKNFSMIVSYVKTEKNHEHA